jgi:hypothetical protein
MKHEDLEAIRADRKERAEQDAAKKAAREAKRSTSKATAKGYQDQPGKKRGRKRKGAASAETATVQGENVAVSGLPTQAVQTGEALIDLTLEGSWTAPVARMW